jgi:hypothetical protein
VDSDLRKIAARVADSAKQLCIKKSVWFLFLFSMFDLMFFSIGLFSHELWNKTKNG